MDIFHRVHGELEDLRAVHLQKIPGRMGLRRQKGTHLFIKGGFAIEVLVQFGGDERFDDAAPGARADDHRAGPVAEEQAGGPVGPIRKAGAGITADDQGIFAFRGHQALPHIQGVIEAAAAGLEIKGRGLPADPQLLLDPDGPGREKLGRGIGAQDDVAQLLRLDPRSLQGLAAGCHRHGDGVLVGGGNAPLMDAAALHDPLGRGLHHLFQVLIGQDRFRQIHPGAQDADLLLAQRYHL